MYLQQLNNAIEYSLERGSFNSLNIIENAKNVCVFGLGTYFNEAFSSQDMKKKFHVNLLSDNDPDKWGKTFESIKCIPPYELTNYESLVVIIMLGNPVPVEKQLKDLGIQFIYHVNLMLDEIMNIPRSRGWFMKEIDDIKKVYSLFHDDRSKKIYVNGLCNRIAPAFSELTWEELFCDEEQYFYQEYFKFHSNETFVDCGSYTGDTILKFCDIVKKYKEIWGFELDKDNFDQMVSNLKNIDGSIHLHNCGVWNENCVLDYGHGSSTNEPSSGISLYKTEPSANNLIQQAQVKRLDDVLKSRNVTYIKMDVEGAEMNALLGAEHIIRTQRPRLSVCVYHKVSDFWQIPLLLNKFNHEYKFVLRHYSKTSCEETVLYAY
jgi:methyltransferase, FkbM family